MIKRIKILILSIILVAGSCYWPSTYSYATEIGEGIGQSYENINDENMQADNYIVSFVALEDYTYQYKLALYRLKEDFPKCIEALDNYGNSVYIDVCDWKCVSDYDQETGEYLFSPVFDENSLSIDLASDIALPQLKVLVLNENMVVADGYIDVEDSIEVPFYEEAVIGLTDDEDMMLLGDGSNEEGYYNAYEAGLMPSIRNQGSEGACWSFAVIGAIEANLILNNIVDNNIDLSELHTAYFTTHNYDDPLNCHDGDTVSVTGGSYLSHGGNSVLACKTLSNGVGTVRESYAPYSKGSEYIIPEDYALGVNYAGIREMGKININDRESIKKAIKNFGAVTASFYATERSGKYTLNGVSKNFNVKYSATYNSFCGDLPSTNHAVMLVGWDDNFSRDNFNDLCKPEGDGAWLVRNSWGLDDYGKYGYFWLSYYDLGLLTGKNAYYFVADTDNFDHIYAYDSVANGYTWHVLASGGGIEQTFSIKSNQSIEAIGFENLDANLDVEIAIECDDNAVVTMQEHIDHIGYHTIKLDEPLIINNETEIKVSIRFNSLDGQNVSVPYESTAPYSVSNSNNNSTMFINNVHEARKTSLIYSDNSRQDINNDALIKVLANDCLETEDRLCLKCENIYEHAGYQYQLEFVENTAGIAINEMTWSSDNSAVATVDSDGVFTVGCCKGQTLIRGSYSGEKGTFEVHCNVTVKPYSINYDFSGDNVKGLLTKEYYPGDLANCVLKPAYKEGYELFGWYSDETFNNPIDKNILINMSENITLYPKWEPRKLRIVYFTVDEYGEYDDYVIPNDGISVNEMPFTLPKASEFDPNLNDYIQDYNAANGTRLAFAYWSLDKEGEEPIEIIDKTNFDFKKDNAGKYTQANYIKIYPQYVETSAVEEVSLNLNGKIGVNFYMSFAPNISYVTLSSEGGKTFKYSVSDIYKKNGLYCYTYNMPVKDMNNDICISVYDDDGKQMPIGNEKAIDGSFYYSAGDYVNMITTGENDYMVSSPKTYNICMALRGYSAAVREQFGFVVEARDEIFGGIALNDINAEDFALYAPEIEVTDSNIQYIGSSLVLNADTGIRHYFAIDNVSDNLKNYRFVLTDGIKQQEIYPVEGNGYCYIEISGIPAIKLDTEFILDIYRNDNIDYADGYTDDSNVTRIGHLYYSPFSYIYRSLFESNSNNTMKYLSHYMKAYNDSAKAYWNDNSSKYTNSVASIQLNTNTLSMSVGSTDRLIATCLPMDSLTDELIWTSSDNSVVSVDKYGQVKAVSCGKALIKVVSSNSIWTQCLVTVSEGLKVDIDKSDSNNIIIYINGEKLEEGTGYINVGPLFEDYSDTAAINKAISMTTEECNTVYIPAGLYAVNACDKIILKDNINIIIDEEAYLDAKPNESAHTDIIYGENVENVTIYGGRIAGERYIHKNNEGEWGMGIGLYSCENIRVYDVDIINCWGDGLYIGSSDNKSKCNNIQIVNCKLSNNRRNNLSIVAGDNIIIDGCNFSYANGVDPQVGLDIETNYESIPCNDISIYNSSFDGNTVRGIAITTAANRVDIVGCKFEDGFLNYAGKDCQIADTELADKTYMRYGMSFGDNVHINDGTVAEDTLVAYYNAALDGNIWNYKYGINDENQMACTTVTGSNDGGRKAVRLNRLTNGTGECGYGLALSSISLDGTNTLEVGATYRFEFVIKGNGSWGGKSNQTPWYPIMPVNNKYMTCVATHSIENSGTAAIYLYSIERVAGRYLDIESMKIYKVN